MKLHKNQYQDILNTIDDFNIVQERLSLIKKKGRIQIHIEGIESYFELFRRKSVILTEPDHQWQRSGHYEIVVNGTPLLLADWQEVLTHLNKWLHSKTK